MRRYPVNDIAKNTACEIHIPIGNLTTRVAVAVVCPVDLEALVIHGSQIPTGYAIVGTDIVENFYMGLDLEIPRCDGDTKLGQAAHGFIPWCKRYIVLPRTPPRPPSPPQQPHRYI